LENINKHIIKIYDLTNKWWYFDIQNKNYKKYWRLLKNIAKKFTISCKYAI
jgi:hypothetical protein